MEKAYQALKKDDTAKLEDMQLLFMMGMSFGTKNDDGTFAFDTEAFSKFSAAITGLAGVDRLDALRGKLEQAYRTLKNDRTAKLEDMQLLFMMGMSFGKKNDDGTFAFDTEAFNKFSAAVWQLARVNTLAVLKGRLEKAYKTLKNDQTAKLEDMQLLFMMGMSFGKKNDDGTFAFDTEAFNKFSAAVTGLARLDTLDDLKGQLEQAYKTLKNDPTAKLEDMQLLFMMGMSFGKKNANGTFTFDMESFNKFSAAVTGLAGLATLDDLRGQLEQAYRTLKNDPTAKLEDMQLLFMMGMSFGKKNDDGTFAFDTESFNKFSAAVTGLAGLDTLDDLRGQLDVR